MSDTRQLAIQPIAYKLKTAAALAAVSEMTFRREIAAGRLKAIRRFRHILIARTELERWLAEAAQ